MIINSALAEIYQELINKAWANPITFEAYQDAWKCVERHFKIPPFDWTRGQRPRTPLEYTVESANR